MKLFSPIVYIIRTPAVHLAASFHKIGVANDLSKRMQSIQTGCPLKIALVGTLKCKSRAQAFDIERRLHLFHDQYKTHGEWFALHGSWAEALDRLVKEWPISNDLEEILSRRESRVGESNPNALIPLTALRQEREETKILRAKVIQLEEILAGLGRLQKNSA